MSLGSVLMPVLFNVCGDGLGYGTEVTLNQLAYDTKLWAKFDKLEGAAAVQRVFNRLEFRLSSVL